MGWIGTVLTVAGVWKLADRFRLALLLLTAGNVFWIIEGIFIQNTALIVVNIALFCLGLRNICLNSSGNNSRTTTS